jgi:cyclic pyranopterin phosphate synthase
MTDVADKTITRRRAVAAATVRLGPEALERLRSGSLAKGDVLAAVRLAGIQAAKRTAEWIPLCHPIPVLHVDVDCRVAGGDPEVEIVATAVARWYTGVEMEAMTAAAAALTLYDMSKGIDRGIEVRDLRLLSKSGGKSGDWKRKT